MAITYLSGQRVQGSSTFATSGKLAGTSGTGSVYANWGRESNNDNLSYDLGATLSETAWVMRFKLYIDTFTLIHGSGCKFFFGMSDLDADTSDTTNQDSITFQIKYSSNASEQNFKGCASNNNEMESYNVELGTNMLTSSAGTTYYVELKRTADDVATISIGTNSDFSSPSETETIPSISSDISGLQYVVGKIFEGSDVGNHVYGDVSEVQICNGVTTFDSGDITYNVGEFMKATTGWKINDSAIQNIIPISPTDEKTTVTDVPAGSEFEQTDDYKTYQMAEALVDGADLKCYIKFNDVDTTDPLVNTASSVTGNGSDTLGTDADMILGGAVDPTYAVTAPTNLGTGAMKFFETAGDGTVGSWGNLGTSASQWKFLHYNSANTSNFPKWTICFWCKMGSDSPNNRNIIRNVSGDSTAGITIYHSDDDVGAGNGGLGIFLTSDDGSAGQVPLAFWSASEFFQYDDAWHFYAFTMDFSLSSATLKMWRDMGTTTPAYQTANKGAGALESGNPSYALGFRHYTANGISDNTFIPPTASYSELSIWDRVLTDAELDKIYNSGAGMDLVTGAKIWVERGTAI